MVKITHWWYDYSERFPIHRKGPSFHRILSRVFIMIIWNLMVFVWEGTLNLTTRKRESYLPSDQYIYAAPDKGWRIFIYFWQRKKKCVSLSYQMKIFAPPPKILFLVYKWNEFPFYIEEENHIVGSNINSLNYWATFNQCCIKFAQLNLFWWVSW